jgi:phosphatidylinositol 4-kinase
MDGVGSDQYLYWKMLMCKGFLEIRKHVDELVTLLNIMMDGSDLECFENFTIESFKERFKPSIPDEAVP